MADEVQDPSQEAGGQAGPPAKKSNPFIPLAIVLVAMPAISVVMVNSVFLPKLQKNLEKMVSDAKAAAANADASAPLIAPSGDTAKAEGKAPAKEGAPAKDAHGAPAKDAHGAPAKDAKDGHGAPAKDAKKDGGHAASGAPAAEKGPKVTSSKEGWCYNFTNVVSNLTGSLGTKYVKCAFTVVSDDEKIGEIVEDNKSKLRDTALSVLSARSLADMEAPGAKNILRSELAANFNRALNSNVVKQIYITDFVIQ